jgi:hypothetical protein
MRSRGIRHRSSATAILAVLAFVSPAVAAVPCALDCKAKVAACRKARCADLRDAARGSCTRDCRAEAGCSSPIRTLAYVLTQCRQEPDGTAGRQDLVIQRGFCDPIVVASVAAGAKVTDPFLGVLGGLCRSFGRFRAGYRSVLAGAFQRIGVTPDGSTVVFEARDALLLPAAFPLAFEPGIYAVAADGSNLRRLAPASRNRSGRLSPDPNPNNPDGFTTSTWDVLYRFSPDSRRIVYTDLGPGPNAEDAIQVVTLDVRKPDSAPFQVTRLPKLPTEPLPAEPDTFAPRFADAHTIAFFSYTNPDGEHPYGTYYLVPADGSGEPRAVTNPVAPADSKVVSNFDVSNGGTHLLGLQLNGAPVGVGSETAHTFLEIFLAEKKHLLQLTNLRRTTTGFLGKVLDRRADRAYFVSPADAFVPSTNPSQNCQLFSIGTTGAGLRQLTRFDEGELSQNGCTHYDRPGCGVGPLFRDAVTGTLVFYSSCDTSSHGGQIYAIRPDGSGLRKLTATRGLLVEGPEVYTVELPGPVAYSAFDGGR